MGTEIIPANKQVAPDCKIPEILPYDNSKPVTINFHTDQLQEGTNVPWVVYSNNKTVVNPMILSNWLKNGVYNGKKIFNYMIAKSSDGSNKYKIFIYNKGVYVEMSSDEFKAAIRIFIPQLLRNKKLVDEVYADMICNDMFVDESRINANEDIINFKDGIFNIRTKELLPHDPKYLTTIQIPTNYKDIEASDGVSEVFDGYINTLCNYDPETIEVLMQIMGLSISNVYGFRTKKSLFLVGKGDSGKSQIKKLVENFIGEKNVSTADLEDLNKQFGKSAMYGKRLVGCNDMSYQHVADMSIFKQATGGDYISIEFKFGGRINYLYKGFLWFNCNDLPSFGGDKGEWVYNRIIPIACVNRIPPEKQDSTLFDKMLKEKNAIIKKTLDALYRLIDNNYKIERTPGMQATLEKYQEDNNTLLTFIKEYCITTDDVPSKTKRSSFMKCYDQYCKIYNRNQGKMGAKAIRDLLKEKYGEEFHKSNGIYYMTKLGLLPDTMKNEFGVFDANETPLY